MVVYHHILLRRDCIAYAGKNALLPATPPYFMDDRQQAVGQWQHLAF